MSRPLIAELQGQPLQSSGVGCSGGFDERSERPVGLFG
jgi:hypothetical protein